MRATRVFSLSSSFPLSPVFSFPLSPVSYFPPSPVFSFPPSPVLSFPLSPFFSFPLSPVSYFPPSPAIQTPPRRVGFSPRGASAPLFAIRARPPKLLRPRHDPCPYRVPLNVPPYPLEFRSILGRPIKVLRLPKCLSSASQDSVSAHRRGPLYISDQISQSDLRGPEQVYVVWHNGIRVESAQPPNARHLQQLFLHHTGDLRLSKIYGPASSPIQQTVKRDESFAGIEMFGIEDTLVRQAPMQPPRNKNRHSRDIPVRQSPPICSHSSCIVSTPPPTSHNRLRRRVGFSPRGASAPLPNPTTEVHLIWAS